MFYVYLSMSSGEFNKGYQLKFAEVRPLQNFRGFDPEGYVYKKEGKEETRIVGAIVSLFWLNQETKQYESWPAKEYQQENPQITDITGKYSFLVPEGVYYLKVEAPNYLVYQGDSFNIKEGKGIHQNIELKKRFWWLWIFSWERMVLILIALLLFFNFYRDKILRRELKH